MKKTLLESITSPEDLKRLDYRELEQLAEEIREFLIENVSKTGGHLSSNLGVIELTLALHRVFSSPQDAIVFDVGHQCYTHKLVTGRQAGFAKLRHQGGISGFPSRNESAHDVFGAGHGSTSISAAIGLARAKKLRGEEGHVIAVIGDGAFTGGLVYEGINNMQGLDNLVVVLNDNTMSISKNVGALAQYFTKLRTSPGYYKAKSDVKNVLDRAPVIGRGVTHGIQSMKSMLRRGLYHSTFFEEMGFRYVGPADGHNLPQLCTLFANVRDTGSPVFVHLETKKGKGFRPAEQNPGAFHGVSSFNARTVRDPDVSPTDSFSNVFGKELVRLGCEDERICAITAAMKYGTGLQYFKKVFPQRFFDVGMAEEHAVTFAAGLAAGGLLPVVAIYSTFLQRAYDQIIHDVTIQNLDVVFAIDRAGLVPGDGETHQGIYDAAFLSQQSQMPVVAPSNYAELRWWLEKLVKGYHGPRAIRYPRGGECGHLAEKECTGAEFDQLIKTPKAQAAIITYGCETTDALDAAALLAEEKQAVDVYQMLVLNPIPPALIQRLLTYKTILFAEEGVAAGGIGEHLLHQLHAAGYTWTFRVSAVPEHPIDHADVPELKAEMGLDGAGLAKTLLEMLPGKPGKR